MLQKRYCEDPAFKMQPQYISEAAMSEVYTSRPVTCSDIILYQNPASVFLTTRRFRPGEGLWVIGGARLAGETAMETAMRKLKTETSLGADTSRFKFLGIIEYIWPYRHQDPSDAGRHDINYVFGLEVTDNELKTVAANLDAKEFDAGAGLKEFTSVDALNEAGAREIIQDYYRELFQGDSSL
jgi:ADP-ribose pyrophosphatase YjhB (NUDIX family)